MSIPNEGIEEKKVSELTPQQRGALITNSGKSPIAGLPEGERKALVQTVLARALQDERLQDIAKDVGVARTSLNQAILKYAEDEWKEVQVARALSNVEDCEEELESAPDMLAVARARERLKSAQWKLERLHRRLFGADAPHTGGSGTIHINIGVSRSNPLNDATVVDAQVVDNKESD